MAIKEMTIEDYNKWAHEFLDGCKHSNMAGPDDPWECYHWYCPECNGRFWIEQWESQDDEFEKSIYIPKYCTDLNLAAQVEAKIGKRFGTYLMNLYKEVGERKVPATPFLGLVAETVFLATAEQRIRAAYETREKNNG